MNPEELEKIKEKINQIRRTRIIRDPYPQHSEYQKILDLKLCPGVVPRKVSIWEAYMEGYAQAYREILENLK